MVGERFFEEVIFEWIFAFVYFEYSAVGSEEEGLL